ncbi:MAG: hypothetical protein ABIB71_06710 [Candidatus Woesearchaeota archaeon]
MKLKAFIVVLAILVMATSLSAGLVAGECLDSDGGLKERVAGSVSGAAGVYKDKCSPIADAVEEQYCDGGAAKSELMLCPEGTTCKEDDAGQGYCASTAVEEGACTDSDGGLNIEVAGFVTGLPGIYRDVCLTTANTVKEWACSEGGEPYSKIIECKEGTECKDGACVKTIYDDLTVPEDKVEDLTVPESKTKDLEARVKALEKRVKELEAWIGQCCPDISKPGTTTASVLPECGPIDKSCMGLCEEYSYAENCNQYCFHKCESNCEQQCDDDKYYKVCVEGCQELFPGVSIESTITTTISSVSDETGIEQKEKTATAGINQEIEQAPSSLEYKKESGLSSILRIIFGKF